MGDFKAYDFKLKMNDQDEHNFFVEVEQMLRSRKCVQVVDTKTLSPNNEGNKSKILSTSVEKETNLDFAFIVRNIEGC